MMTLSVVHCSGILRHGLKRRANSHRSPPHITANIAHHLLLARRFRITNPVATTVFCYLFAKSGCQWYKSSMSCRRAPSRCHFLALLAYTLLALLLTYPLVGHLSTHVPGDGIDDPALAWNLWWIKYGLVDRQINPFFSSWMFHPIGINLAFYTLTVLNGLVALPLQIAFNLVLASNLMLLSSFVLSGFGAYLLALAVLAGAHAVGNRAARATATSPGTTLAGAALSPAAILYVSAFIAGLLYAFSSSKLFYAALGQFNIASSQWIPFAVLYVLRSGRPGARLREPLLAGLFLLLQAYAELTYATFLLIFVVIFVVYRVVLLAAAVIKERKEGKARNERGERKSGEDEEQRRAEWMRLLRNLGVLGLVVLIGLMPLLANMLPDMRAEGDFLVEGGGFADIFSADLAGYALPTQLHPVFGNLIRTLSQDSQLRADGSQWQVNKGQHLTLGYLGLALMLVGIWKGRRRQDVWFWVIAVVVFFLLTLGPSVRVAGHDSGIPGPFRLVQSLPFFKGNRYPSRYSVMLLMAAVPLVALGTQALLTAVQQPLRPKRATPVGVALLLAAALLFENLSAPLPLSDMRIPRIYDIIAADPGDFAVLDLPVGWRNGFSVFGKQDVIIMAEQWWQTRHERPILGGNTSRNPEHKFRYFLEAPLIGALTVLANADPAHPHIQAAMSNGLAALRAGDPALGGDPLLQDAAAEAADTLQALNVRYVVVHRAHVPSELMAFVEQHLPVELIAEDGEHALYRVQPRPLPTQIVLRPAVDPLSRGEGWSGVAPPAAPVASNESAALWAHRTRTRLLLPPIAPRQHRITVRAQAAGPNQTLALLVNGHRTAAQPLPQTWTELTFDLPTDVLRAGINTVDLLFDKTYPSEEVKAAGLLPTINLLVESAGLEAGNFGHIWLDGRDISPSSRGYNLAIIDGSSGQLRSTAGFDTHADPNASAALIEFVSQMGQNDILAVAVKDTAGDQLSAEAAAALTQLGLSDLRGRFRWSQAGLVWPAAGQPTLEAISPVQSTRVGVGAGWREPQAAALVASVVVE